MTIATGEVAEAADVNAIGAGHITILPSSYNAIGQGTWAYVLTATEFLGGIWGNSGTHADGDNISYKVYLAAGTYTLGMLCLKTSDRGIADFDIDAGEVASFDLYDAGALRNQWVTQASISVTTAGLKTLKLRIDGKNGSSSDHVVAFQYIALWRTA